MVSKLPFSENYLPWHLPPAVHRLVPDQLSGNAGDHSSGRSRAAGTHLHIAVDEGATQQLTSLMQYFRPEVRVLQFDSWDCLPYDRVSPKADVMGARVAALVALLVGSAAPTLVITTIPAVMQRVMPPDALRGHGLMLRAGSKVNIQDVQNFLEGNAYSRASTVREAGEYAIRGGIVDLFPPDSESPIRIDFFGSDIERIQMFDPVTQISTGAADSINLIPAREVILNAETIAQFRSGYRELFGAEAAKDPLYETISEARLFPGMEHWLPLFYENTATLFNYLPPDCTITLDHQWQPAARERIRHICDHYQTRREFLGRTGPAYRPLPPERLYLSDEDLVERIAKFVAAETDPFNTEFIRPLPSFAEARSQRGAHLFHAASEFMRAAQAEGKQVLLTAYSEGSSERLLHLFNEHAPSIKFDHAILPIEKGFITNNLTLITEEDILGDRLVRAPKRRSSQKFIAELAALAPDDLVVHAEHGIGKFLRLETINVAGAAHDCLLLEYAGGDKLYVPVENLDVLTRYGQGDAQADRLGGANFQARKAAVKKRLKDMAAELMKIAAARALNHAETLSVPEHGFDEFCARFPYVETEDQLKAIEDVLNDLQSGRATDRLICGDVGFGKTEVALRAAFVAAMAGMQVAICAPTTLLVRQHFQSFSARFLGLPIRIAQLSRLVNARDAKQTKEDLRAGKVDIIIGTHALLSADIGFKHLGLLVIDEEQRFGVRQKERLKQLKANVHVVTLTATPIPRTMQMAFSGIKDLSLITTPPVDRLAVRTFAMSFDALVVREALMREHYRGGQSFVVCPRISDIEAMQKTLAEIVPELKTIAAHGQMGPAMLEDRMQAFVDGKYDILLATHIIESGLDIPRANTMVIHRADLYGLAQLYQLRGRIGRSKLRGYAYLTWPAEQRLSKTSQTRLEIIASLDTLGAGFQLASHDLDLRGAGNLLGEEQSGHIKEVGIELFQQMLEDAVREAQAHGVAAEHTAVTEWTPVINLGLPVMIPEDYVTDLNVRLSLYRRLASLVDAGELESFAAELRDRFGPLPDEVQNLMQVMQLKALCRAANIAKVDAGPKGAVLQFYRDHFANVGGLLIYIQKHLGNIKFRPDQKIVITRDWEDERTRLRGLRDVLSDISEIAI